MARSLNIPAIVGLHDITAKLETGRGVLLDGTDGVLIVVHGRRCALPQTMNQKGPES